MEQVKVCTKCGVRKPLEEFHSEPRVKDGRQARCKACKAVADADYYESNKYKPKYKERNAAATATWTKANPEKKAAASAAWYAANKERKAEAYAAWAKANPEKRRAVRAKRRAAKLNRIPPWADLEAIEFFEIMKPPGAEIDHIIPMQGRIVSGFHELSNLQYLTPTENRSKGNKFNWKEYNKINQAKGG